MSKRRVIFTADPVEVFDTISKVGPDAAFRGIGDRMAAAMLAEVGFADRLGLAVYGITVEEETVPDA